MDLVKLLGCEALDQLIANGKEQEPLKGTREERDFPPVAKIFFALDERDLVVDGN